MKILFAPEPYEGGTPYAESFLSVLHRTCAIYRVPFHAMVRLLLALSPITQSIKSIQSQTPFLTYSEMTESLTTQFGRLAGSMVYRNHTLLKLRGVLARNGTGAIESDHRWCPDCLHPKSGTGYGMLAHCMSMLEVCPLHHRWLRRHCTRCGRKPTLSKASPFNTDCQYCQAPLWHAGRQEQMATSRLDERASRILEVVAYATDPELSPPAQTWSDEVYEGLGFLASNAASGSYEGKELRDIQRRLRVQEDRFTLGTLLRLSAMQMISPKELFIAPMQAFSARLPNMYAEKPEFKSRKSKLVDLWFALRRTANELLELPSSDVIPALNRLCELVGTTSSSFWQHYPKISTTYTAERIKRLNGRSHTPYARLFAVLYPVLTYSESRRTRRADLAPPDALDGACRVIEKNLAKWIVRSRHGWGNH